MAITEKPAGARPETAAESALLDPVVQLLLNAYNDGDQKVLNTELQIDTGKGAWKSRLKR